MAHVLGALGAVIGLTGVMLLTSALRRPRRTPLPDGPGDISTSPFAEAIADAQVAEGYPRQPVPLPRSEQ